MSYVFDSSSIFKAMTENVVEAVAGNCTLELARFELGTILWKKYAVEGRATGEELKRLAKLVKEILNLMEVVTISCHEEEILGVAEGLRLTFYDASYVYCAKRNKLSLVTEDSDLMDKAKTQVKALKLDDIV